MRLRVALLLAMSIPAGAQRTGGMPAGRAPSGSAPGRPAWGWRGQRNFRPWTFYWPYPWIGPTCPVLGADPYSCFPSGYDNSAPYPTAPAGAAPPMNMLLQPPLAPPPNNPLVAPPPPSSAVAPSPPPAPIVQQDSPPLIVLKTGAMYSAQTYWVQNGNLSFVTSLGDSLQVPLAAVDHIYPGIRQAQSPPQ
jgi:hypothetical protein